MPEINDVAPAGAVKSAAELASLRTVTTVVYGLQALSFFWGVPAIVGLIINYVKREDARGTLYESHFDWQIRTFWWGLLWAVLGGILAIVLVGIFVMIIAWIWMIYRVVKGWLRLIDNQPVHPA